MGSNPDLVIWYGHVVINMDSWYPPKCPFSHVYTRLPSKLCSEESGFVYVLLHGVVGLAFLPYTYRKVNMRSSNLPRRGSRPIQILPVCWKSVALMSNLYPSSGVQCCVVISEVYWNLFSSITGFSSLFMYRR